MIEGSLGLVIYSPVNPLLMKGVRNGTKLLLIRAFVIVSFREPESGWTFFTVSTELHFGMLTNSHFEKWRNCGFVKVNWVLIDVRIIPFFHEIYCFPLCSKTFSRNCSPSYSSINIEHVHFFPLIYSNRYTNISNTLKCYTKLAY